MGWWMVCLPFQLLSDRLKTCRQLCAYELNCESWTVFQRQVWIICKLMEEVSGWRRKLMKYSILLLEESSIKMPAFSLKWKAIWRPYFCSATLLCHQWAQLCLQSRDSMEPQTSTNTHIVFTSGGQSQSSRDNVCKWPAKIVNLSKFPTVLDCNEQRISGENLFCILCGLFYT